MRDTFTRLGSNLIAFIEKDGSIIRSTFNNDFAELLIQRDGPNGKRYYEVLLIRGDDGIWRIDGMWTCDESFGYSRHSSGW